MRRPSGGRNPVPSPSRATAASSRRIVHGPVLDIRCALFFSPPSLQEAQGGLALWGFDSKEGVLPAERGCKNLVVV